jgi:hypothetical protein
LKSIEETKGEKSILCGSIQKAQVWRHDNFSLSGTVFSFSSLSLLISKAAIKFSETNYYLEKVLQADVLAASTACPRRIISRNSSVGD